MCSLISVIVCGVFQGFNNRLHNYAFQQDLPFMSLPKLVCAPVERLSLEFERDIGIRTSTIDLWKVNPFISTAARTIGLKFVRCKLGVVAVSVAMSLSI